MEQELINAYAAGILDGEGCIGVYRGNRKTYIRYELKVSVKMTSFKTVRWLKIRFGGSISTPTMTGNRQPAYVWQISGALAASFLKKVQKYLVTKDEHAILGIQFHDQLFSPQNRLRKASPALNEARDRFVITFKQLNRRGIQ